MKETMSEIIKPGKKFLNEYSSQWKDEVYNRIVKKTRRNLVAYSDIQRVLMYCRGDVEKAAELIDQKKIPSNPEVMMSFHERLCDIENVLTGCCTVLAQTTGYDPNQSQG